MKRKNILVTGADGFIGSHLCEGLLETGHRVKALSLYNSFNYWGWLEDLKDRNNLKVICGDVRDKSFCKDLVKDVDIVFHLAALIAIPYSYIAPYSYFDTNVTGTLNICEAIKGTDIRLIHTSTSEVYGTAQYVPINECHPKQAQSPYSASKIAADALALSYYNSFGTRITVARPFNTYGPRQSARAIIPTIITQIISGVKKIKVGDLSPTRDFNYVKDTVRGFISIMDYEETIGKEVNICSNYEVSMSDTLNLIAEIMNKEVSFIVDQDRIRPKTSEVFRLWGDNTLISKLTGFKPEYSLKKGLELTCKWFEKTDNLAKYKSDIYNI